MPKGYMRHEDNFVYWAKIVNDEVVVSDKQLYGSFKIDCKVLLDDYGNGAAEYIIDNFLVDEGFHCDYIRTGFNWNYVTVRSILFIEDYPFMDKYEMYIGNESASSLEERHRMRIETLLNHAKKTMDKIKNKRQAVERLIDLD